MDIAGYNVLLKRLCGLDATKLRLFVLWGGLVVFFRWWSALVIGTWHQLCFEFPSFLFPTVPIVSLPVGIVCCLDEARLKWEFLLAAAVFWLAWKAFPVPVCFSFTFFVVF